MGPLDEELDGSRGGIVSDGERRDGPEVLARQAHALPAGHEDVHTWIPAVDDLDERAHGVQQVLAVVEHQQRAPAGEPLGYPITHRRARRRCDGECVRYSVGNRPGVAHGGQLDQPDAVRELRHQLPRRLDGKARLAHASHSRQRHQAVLTHGQYDVFQLDATTDERRRRRGQVAEGGVQRAQRRELPPQAVRAGLVDPLRAGQVAQPVLAEVEQSLPVQ